MSDQPMTRPEIEAETMAHTDRPDIVVLCGSTKFKTEFETETLRLAKSGVIVLTVSCFGHMGDLTAEECEDGHPVKVALDDLHKRKIDMADSVLVINPSGYIGTSTASEISYARYWNKPISSLEPMNLSDYPPISGGV